MTDVTLTELAKLTGWSTHLVKKRLDGVEPLNPQAGKFIYDSKTTLPRIYTSDSPSAEISLQGERARLAFHQANKAELDEQTAGGNLLPLEMVEESWNKLVASMRAKLLAMPVKFSAALLGVENKAEIRDIAKTMIEAALAELSTDDIDNQPATEEDTADGSADAADKRQPQRKPRGKSRPKAKQKAKARAAVKKPRATEDFRAAARKTSKPSS